MGQAWTFKEKEGVGYLSFDLPNEKINKLNPKTLNELEEHIDRIGTNLKALVFVSGKKGTFIAGADLKEMEQDFQSKEKVRSILELGHRIFLKIEELPFPTIAVITGVCLGGGLELALSCTYRIATDSSKVSIGLPEVSLGIIPGWGGSQRLPRLVGLQQGLHLILSGKQIDAKKAWKIGLVDKVVSEEFIQQQLPGVIAGLTSGKIKRKEPKGMVNWLLEKNPAGRAIVFSSARKSVLKKTKGHYPSPIIALDLIQKTYSLPLKKGLEKEKEVFINNVETGFKNAKHIINVFFGMEHLKKREVHNFRDIERIGVVGAGMMGSGIAWLGSYRGHDIRLKDVNWNAIANGYESIHSMYNQIGKFKRLPKQTVNTMMHRISYSVSNNGFKQQELVIEAATENLDLKHKIIAELEEHLPSDAIIATNTSSLRIDEMASKMKHPERFLGMHFFNPVNRMPLVEIAKGSKTSEEALATAVKLCQKWKKVPLVVNDCNGFLVNRVFAMQANELMHLFEEGVPMEKLEKVIEDFGWPMGPFTLADQVGNDVGFKVFNQFEEAYGKRMAVPKILEEVKNKELYGKKTGKGFFIYEGNKKRKNPEIQEILDKRGITPVDKPASEIIDRVICVTANEAARCIEEGIVSSAKDVDLGLILGTGFPPFRGGLLAYVDELGVSNIVDKMKDFEKKLGSRFSPCDLIKKTNKFYS